MKLHGTAPEASARSRPPARHEAAGSSPARRACSRHRRGSVSPQVLRHLARVVGTHAHNGCKTPITGLGRRAAPTETPRLPTAWAGVARRLLTDDVPSVTRSCPLTVVEGGVVRWVDFGS
jgi:hypothetical protein